MNIVVKKRWLPGRGINGRTALAVGALICLIAAAIAFRAHQCARDPLVYYLAQQPEAEWIRSDTPFVLRIYEDWAMATLFSASFTTFEPVSDARLVVSAFRRCAIELDGHVIYEDPEELDDWKTPKVIPIPGPVPAGPHLLRMRVLNTGAHPCVWAYSEELGVRTSPQWRASVDGKTFPPAISATYPRQVEVADRYPSAKTAFWSLAPWLGGLFVICFVYSAYTDSGRGGLSTRSGWRIPPPTIRWLLLFAWTALGLNNIWKLPPAVGYDVGAHLAYIQFIAERHALPLATDGWQTFQSPLFYLLAAPFYSVLSSYFDSHSIVMILRFLPLLCGLAQIEIAYRAARLVFRERDDLQTLATLIGGLLPMHIYISQVIGNEPLAGCLTALVMLFCFGLVTGPPRRNGYFVALGAVWGLALLSKVTPILLTPIVVAAVVVSSRASRVGARRTIGRLAYVFVACGLVSGWYFARNWAHLGKPFVGGWDPAIGAIWWQDPSYRTWSQLSSFGLSLNRPLYSGTWSLWDSLYSTMWLDGFTSSVVIFKVSFLPWNTRWLIAGAWLGLVPSALMAASLATMWLAPQRPARPALLLAAAAVAIYLAAIVDLFLRLPVYSTAKATYAVGLLPCFALLAAAGAAPLMKWRWTRAAVLSMVICWAVAAYAAYFVGSFEAWPNTTEF